MPRGGETYSDAERARFAAHPDELARLRARPVRGGRGALRLSVGGSRRHPAAAQATALAHLSAQVADPRLRATLTPDYAFGCKRVLLSDDFYPALASGDVTLEASALAAVEGATLVAASGSTHEVDVVVLATGFASTRQPYADLVRGERRHRSPSTGRTG